MFRITYKKTALLVLCLAGYAMINYPLQGLRKENKVEVDIGWEYQNVPGKVKIYEPRNHPKLWQTQTVKNLSDAPVGAEIKDAKILMGPGQSREFVLVMKNETTHPLYFFAAPHHVTPPEYSLGFKFHCLCVNMTYSVNPGSYWYRVVRLDLMPGFRGDHLKVVHTLIRLEKPVNVFMDSSSHDH